jgi:hypothetical protein
VDIPQGSTIKLIGYTEKIINDKLYTSRSELTLKVADFVIEKISVENVVDGVYQAILNQTRLLRVQLAEVSYNANIPGIAKKLRNVLVCVGVFLFVSNSLHILIKLQYISALLVFLFFIYFLQKCYFTIFINSSDARNSI